MGSVHIVTDSGADLPPELAYPRLHVVPLTVHFGQESLRDGVELTVEDFYRRLRQASQATMPRTSQPSPAEFEAVYRPLVEAGHSIVSVHLSAALSGTLQSATLAARSVGGEIYVVDSLSASLGIGLLAWYGARLADAGQPAGAIAERLKALREKLAVFFTVDTLEYLQRNGRIGKAQAFVGGLLNVKPVLTLRQGVVHPVERVRGKAKALARIVDHAVEAVGERPVRLAVMHGDVPDEAERLTAMAKSRLQVEELVVAPLGPIIGTHAGPGSLGMVCIPVEAGAP